MNISLPEALKAFFDERVNRADQVSRAERELALLLRKGLAGKGIVVNRAYWARKRRRIARGRS